MTTEEKIIACYPHVLSKSIHKMIGCKYHTVYGIMLRLGMKNIKRKPKGFR